MSIRTPLARVRGLGSARSGTEHWWRQRLTAIANLPLVVFFVVLIVANLGADHAQAVAVIGSPVVAVALLLLVLSVTYHMRLGMQVVIEDYIHGHGLKLAALIANTFFAVIVALACAFAILLIAFGT